MLIGASQSQALPNVPGSCDSMVASYARAAEAPSMKVLPLRQRERRASSNVASIYINVATDTATDTDTVRAHALVCALST